MVRTMIKGTIVATLGLLLTTIAAPVIAAPTEADIKQHLNLLVALEDHVGIDVIVNPKVCDDDDFDGAYVVQDDKAYLVVCQDNRVIGERGNPNYAWTDNDLDTIRHETFHLVQDCVDGKKDLKMNLTYPSIEYVIDQLGNQALPIMFNYYQRGVRDSHEIYLELEAFLAAGTQDAEGIALAVATYCPTR